MRSTFSGLEIAKRSLFAQQTALQTTGHNISNANTKGYTRQVVNLVASRPLEAVGMTSSALPGQIGQGVEFDHINRIREKFLDNQFYNENKNYGEWSVRQDTLEKLETIVNEPSDTSIRTVMEKFWNSWQELSKAPENLTARAVVKENALALTDAFNHVSNQLSDLNSDLTENITVKATQIDTTLNQIVSLNKEIRRIEGLGNDANDLRDQRDVLVDDLSKMINVTVTDTANGYNISMGGTPLVTGINLEATVDSDFLVDASSSGELASGEVRGLIDSRDKIVTSFQKQLDTMVKTMAEGDVKVTLPAGTVLRGGTDLNPGATPVTLSADTEVTVKGINGLHQLGYTLNGDITSPGEPFFTLKDGATEFSAASITVNPKIVKNVENIASSLRTYYDDVDKATKVVKGNNGLALLMSGLSTKDFNFDPANTGDTVLNGGTVDEFFRAFVGEIGVQSQEAQRQASNQKLLVDQVDSRRQSVSGVSLDEEMANMIKYQHAYNAAARAMTTFDECLDKIINSMGVVGR
ncbi:flagellar hook-associated protein FlgK [Gorillibacterium timonense]|uniref:flagellar hook-associated protein FlgK n=1 Tax=Gorillibacterium timonense TaxID=1689269 RepID=UPI00071E4BDC|nr:flagellar hook-associated protein FlgK [Gorillibacterium timonense]